MRMAYGLKLCLVATCTIAVYAAVAQSQSAIASSPAIAPPGTSYNEAKNLTAYINELRFKPGAGGALLVAEAKAREECAVFGVIPSYSDDEIRSLKSSNVPYAQVRIDMYKRLEERCQGFTHLTKLDRSEVASLYDKAAKAGNAEAAAHNLVRSSRALPESSVLIRALSIIKTRNPAAIFELSALFEKGGVLRLANAVDVSGGQVALAWRLAACDLGYDCSYSSYVVQQACMFGGICGSGGYRENVQSSGATPHQFEQITTLKNRINMAIRNGTIARFITTRDKGGVGFKSSCGHEPLAQLDEIRSVTNRTNGSVVPFLGFCDPSFSPPTIDASRPPYNTDPVLAPNVGIHSATQVRAAADTSAAGWYRQSHGFGSLGRGSIFKIKYQDGTSETVVVTLKTSSLGAVPIPGTGIESNGEPTGTVPVGEPIEVTGAGGDWTCTYDGSDWLCLPVVQQ